MVVFRKDIKRFYCKTEIYFTLYINVAFEQVHLIKLYDAVQATRVIGLHFNDVRIISKKEEKN